MFGLEDRHLDFIKNILFEFFPTSETKCYIFGSRAKGCEKNTLILTLLLMMED